MAYSWQGVSVLVLGESMGVRLTSVGSDGNIRYYEYENDNLFPLAEYKSSDPQRGMCFLPRRGLSVSDCEIARALKVAANSIEAIAFIVPRKVRPSATMVV